MLNIAICDDEEKYVLQTKEAVINILKDFEFVISTYTSGLDIISDSKRIDILFIDIEMPGLNGIETIKKLREINPSIIVFILTNYTNYMTDVFRVGTFQFLKKPLNEDDLKYDLLRAIDVYKREHFQIKIKENDNIRVIDISKIRYLEVYQKELKFRLLKEEVITRGRMSEYGELLQMYGFAKTHKSFLINMAYIKRIGQNEIELEGVVEKIPLSRNYKEALLSSFNKYLMEKTV